MPINNLNNAHLTEAQMNEIKTALSTLETALSALNVTLTPEERRTYGSVNEQNKLLINKVWDYRQNSPHLSQPDLDWAEFENDLKSRQFIENITHRVAAIVERLRNSKILHDYDNYQAALDDYAYTNYKAGSNAPGYETKMNELKQFFPRSGKRPATDPQVEEYVIFPKNKNI